ncbi:MAG TPA: type IV toxin-antitoxin system AbiEi family antitoxin domain-containing protein [Iamia sp.]
MDTDTRSTIASLASRQMGLITRDQMLRAGVSRSAIWRQSRAGHLLPAGRTTFRLPAVARSPDADVLAACLDHDGVASHRTAAWLHGLRERPPDVEVTVPRMGRRWPSPIAPTGVVVHSSTDLPVGDIILVRDIPTTTVARTLLGLGALVPRHIAQEELAEIMAEACERGPASERWLFWLLERRRIQGRAGVIAFEEALAARVRLGPTESWLERETLRIIEEAGLPLPRVQRRVERRGRFVGRVDLRYDRRPVVIEALGYAHHRSRADLERDTRRANALQLAGNQVLQFSYDQVVRDPTSVTADIAEALGIRLAVAA